MKTFPPFVRSTHRLLSVLALLTLGTGSLFAGEPTPTPTPAALIANLSTRLRCEKRDAAIVTEFAVEGPGTKYVILRAIGPSLINAGIPDALRNPTLTLLDAQGNVLDFNDDWVNSPDKDAIIATGIPPSDRRESAIVYTLAPGIYTTVLRGVHGRTGVALSEIYDLETSNPYIYLSAVGTRGDVLTGDHVMISGAILTGTGPISVLLRVLGPSLAASGLHGVLANPVLELHDGNGALIASNDNWRDTQEAEIIATGLAPDDDLESALIATLSPGAYTAVIRGFDNGTGLAFYQLYSLAIPGPELNPAPIIRGQP